MQKPTRKELIDLFKRGGRDINETLSRNYPELEDANLEKALAYFKYPLVEGGRSTSAVVQSNDGRSFDEVDFYTPFNAPKVLNSEEFGRQREEVKDLYRAGATGIGAPPMFYMTPNGMQVQNTARKTYNDAQKDARNAVRTGTGQISTERTRELSPVELFQKQLANSRASSISEAERLMSQSDEFTELRREFFTYKKTKYLDYLNGGRTPGVYEGNTREEAFFTGKQPNFYNRETEGQKLTPAQEEQMRRGFLVYDHRLKDMKFITYEESAQKDAMRQQTWVMSTMGLSQEIIFASIAFDGMYEDLSVLYRRGEKFDGSFENYTFNGLEPGETFRRGEYGKKTIEEVLPAEHPGVEAQIVSAEEQEILDDIYYESSDTYSSAGNMFGLFNELDVNISPSSRFTS